MRLSEWARQQGVSYQTAWRWVRDGKMPVPVRQAPSGTWLVDEVAAPSSGRVVAYCRGGVLPCVVSRPEGRPGSAGRAGGVRREWTGGLAVAEVVTEVGSGLNRRRRKLHLLLADPDTAVIVVEHRDRLARFGVEHLEAALSASGRRLVVLDPAETADDLVRDVTEVLTSMCARLYGQRAAKTRAARAVAVATGEDGE
ncbi:IS607 family transposase [Streptomyces sp. NPDC005251]|uniref:IS607 family transposase n=1 Tax=Streptomyces sp. NPDC005251 TaxID=3157166 RepID=UPI0033A7B24B